MPNLQQIQAFRSKYGSNNNLVNDQLRTLNESFNKSVVEIKSLFQNRNLDQNIIRYFEEQKSADLILLFIDITSFSQKSSSMTNSELSKYLDDYYDKVISTIYRHGGEIEKIIGDGIICIFGEPFLSISKPELFAKADRCAKDIIIELKGTDKEVKIALHDGTVMYYKNKSVSYSEYTVIGQPLTELFRLESVSENNSISYYHVCKYDSIEGCKEGVYCISFKNVCSYWRKSELISVTLKGVNWSFIKNFRCTYKTD